MQKSSLVAAPARAAATRSDGVFAEERRPNAPIRSSSTPKLAVAVPGVFAEQRRPNAPSRSSSTPKLAIAVPGASIGSVHRMNSGGQGVLVPLGPSRFTVGDAVSAEIPVAALTAVATPGTSTPRVAAPATSQIVLERPRSEIVIPMVAAPGTSQIVSLDRPPASPRSDIVATSGRSTPRVAAPGTSQIVSLDRPPSGIVAAPG